MRSRICGCHAACVIVLKALKSKPPGPFTGDGVPLYNPRPNNWHEHFSWSADGARSYVAGLWTVLYGFVGLCFCDPPQRPVCVNNILAEGNIDELPRTAQGDVDSRISRGMSRRPVQNPRHLGGSFRPGAADGRDFHGVALRALHESGGSTRRRRIQAANVRERPVGAGALAERRPDSSGPPRAFSVGQVRHPARQALSLSIMRETMSRTFHLAARGVILLLLCAPVFGQAQSSRDASPRQKEAAVTIDDLPLSGPRIRIG